MKLKNTLIILSAVILTALTIVILKNTSLLSTNVASPFPDVSENSDHFTAIKYLNEQDILRGNADGTFKPKSTLNRAEWAAILSRLAGAEPSIEDYNNCFPDVKEEWFAPYVCLAKDQGWVNGYSAGELKGLYAPERPVQDIEVLATLASLTDWGTEDSEIWYEPALNYALDHNIYDESDPILNITREDMAEIIFRTIAAISSGIDIYSQDLDSTVEDDELYDIVDIDLENYTGSSLVPKISVTSDDGKVELEFEEEDLPEGINESDIGITIVALEDASEEIKAFYSFEPDGLVFENPVTIKVTSDYNPDSIPMLFHISGEKLEPVHEPEISVNEEKTEYIVSAEINSFSNYMLIDGIFNVSSIDPGVKRVGEIFFQPFTVIYPKTRDITLKATFPGTDTVLTWKMRLEKQYVSALWKASFIYDPYSAVDAPPLAEMSDGFFTHKQEFRCVSPGDGVIQPSIYIQYHYRLLDENDKPGELFIEGAFANLWLNGSCVMPEAENLKVETQCGGSVDISGNLNKYHVETNKIKIFIKKAGTNGAFVSFEEADYKVSGGKFTYTKNLEPGLYEYSVSALMIGAYTTFEVSKRYEFEILPCPDSNTIDDTDDANEYGDDTSGDDAYDDTDDDDESDDADDAYNNTDTDDDYIYYDDTYDDVYILECPEGLTPCSGECVNLQTDNNNCSACGVVCYDGTSCSNGGCYGEEYDYGTGGTGIY